MIAAAQTAMSFDQGLRSFLAVMFATGLGFGVIYIGWLLTNNPPSRTRRRPPRR